MQLNNINKIEEGLYSVESLPCPKCESSMKTELTGRQLHAYRNDNLIDEVLPDLNPGDRERFITGICPPCWDEMFQYEEEEA